MWDNLMDSISKVATLERINFSLMLMLGGVVQGCFFVARRSFLSILQMVAVSIFVGNVAAPVIRDNTDWSEGTVLSIAILLAFTGQSMLTAINRVALRVAENPYAVLECIIKHFWGKK